jgi:hypothetical protein
LSSISYKFIQEVILHDGALRLDVALASTLRVTPGTMAQKLSQGLWQLYRHLSELSIILALAWQADIPG